MTMPFAFAVSQFTTLPQSFEQDIACYGALGVAAIEVVEDKLAGRDLADCFARVADAGMTVCAVQPSVRTFLNSRMVPEPTRTVDRVACLRSSIERLARFAPGAPFITNSGAHSGGNMAAAMAITETELRRLAPVAADHGVRLALEPLNPLAMNAESMIWTVDQALDIIEGVGHPAVGLCLDLWNVWQNAALPAAISRAGDRIFSLQVGDWRPPRSGADRLVPGDGGIPLGPLLRAVAAAGFRGPATLELFSIDVADSLYDRSPRDVILCARAALEEAWISAA